MSYIDPLKLRDVPEILELYEIVPGTDTCKEGQIWRKERIIQRKYKNGVIRDLPLPRYQFKAQLDFAGYPVCDIYVQNIRYHIFVHRAIAELYCNNSNPDILTQVNHINGIKTDNRPCNLEWCTGSQNCKHAISTGLRGRGAYPVIDLSNGKIYESTYDVDRCLGKPLEYTRQRLQADKLVDGKIMRLLIRRNVFDKYSDRFKKYHVVMIQEIDGALTKQYM